MSDKLHRERLLYWRSMINRMNGDRRRQERNPTDNGSPKLSILALYKCLCFPRSWSRVGTGKPGMIDGKDSKYVMVSADIRVCRHDKKGKGEINL